MSQKSPRKDYLWNSTGVLLQNAVSPLLLVVITRVNGIYDSGLFSFAFAVAIIFWAFGMWGGRTYQVSDVKNEFSHRSYIVVRIILALTMIIGALLFSFVNNYDTMKTVLILTLVIFKSIESIADALYGIMQSHGNLYKSGRSLALKAIAGLVVFLIVDILTRDILLASVSILLVNLIIVLLYDLPVTKSLERINIKRDELSYYIKDAMEIIRRTVAVFLVSFLGMFSLNIPRYFIDMYYPEEIGYFGILAMPITLIVLTVSFILQPKVLGLAESYHTDKEQFDRAVRGIIKITLLIGGCVLLVALTVGVLLLELIFGVSFANYRSELLIIVGGSIANAIIAVHMSVLVIMRRFKSQFYILLTTNIILVILSIFLIREGGLLIGVSLFTITNILQAIMMFIAYKRNLRRARNG